MKTDSILIGLAGRVAPFSGKAGEDRGRIAHGGSVVDIKASTRLGHLRLEVMCLGCCGCLNNQREVVPETESAQEGGDSRVVHMKDRMLQQSGL